MKKFSFSFFFLILSIALNISSIKAIETSSEIIGKVNGEKLYLSKFNRLFNAKKRELEKTITVNEQTEKEIKEKLLNHLINEALVIQEAKTFNIEVPNEIVLKKLELIKEKQGGEEEFKKFLAINNATDEDAKSEIKNKILFNLIKNKILETEPFETFLSNKRKNSEIVVFNDKIYNSQANNLTDENTIHDVSLRLIPYPTIRAQNPKLDDKQEVKKVKKSKFNLLSKLTFKKKNDVLLLSLEQQEELNKRIRQKQILDLETNDSSTSQTIKQAIEGDLAKVTINEEPKIIKPINSKSFSVDLNSLNVFKSDKKNIEDLEPSKDRLKVLEELRKKIDQRRILVEQQ